jgi:hypothetical protein
MTAAVLPLAPAPAARRRADLSPAGGLLVAAVMLMANRLGTTREDLAHQVYRIRPTTVKALAADPEYQRLERQLMRRDRALRRLVLALSGGEYR